MLLAPLEQRELNHPALQGDHLQWHGRRCRYLDWDGNFIEYKSKANTEKLDFVHKHLKNTIVIIAKKSNALWILDKIIDEEICGSNAFGNQTVSSDIDVQLPCATYEDQRLVEAFLAKHKNKNILKNAVRDLSFIIGCSIEIHYSVHNNKAMGVEVFSLRERKLYNREYLEAKPANYHKRFKSKIDKNGKEIGKYEINIGRGATKLDSFHWDEDGNETHQEVRLLEVLVERARLEGRNIRGAENGL